MTKFCEKALFDVFRQLMLFDIFWWALGINLITPILADSGFHVPDNDHPFELWESPWCEHWAAKVKLNAQWLNRQPKLFSPADCLLGGFVSKNWDDHAIWTELKGHIPIPLFSNKQSTNFSVLESRPLPICLLLECMAMGTFLDLPTHDVSLQYELSSKGKFPSHTLSTAPTAVKFIILLAQAWLAI